MINDIKNAKPEDMDEILNTVLNRYREIYTDWDMTVISLDRRESRETQIRRIRELLDNL